MKRLVVCILIAGCGGGDNGTIDVDNFGMELAVASCAKQFDCCTDAEIAEQYMGITYDDQPITTEEQCVEFATALFTTFATATFKESIEMGRVEYDGDAAADCVAAIESVSCSEYGTGAAALEEMGCRPYLIPKVAEGGGCTQDFECTTHNCVGAMQSGGQSTDGMCKPMPTAGEPCDDNCADGSYCAYDLTAGDDICQPLKADGAECGYDDECTSDDCDDMTDVCVTPAPVCNGR